jgi:integrase
MGHNLSDNELELMWQLIVDNGMRLRECNMLKASYIDFEKNLLMMQNSKTHGNNIVYRNFPMRAVVSKTLKCAD